MSAMSTTGAGKTWRSASTIVATEEIGYHLLKIDGYSRNKYLPSNQCLKSRPFTVGSHRWRLSYYPSGQAESYCKDYVCFGLVLDQDVDTSVSAKYKIYLVDDEAEEKAPSSSSFAASPVFQFTRYRRGPSTCIWRQDFEKSQHLSNDSFTVRCDIVVMNDCHMADTTVSSSMPPCDLRQHLADLLRSEKGADVVFEVAGKRIAAHRCVLAARSSVFCAQLLGSMKEGINNTTGAVVHVEDMDADVFKELLFFAYTGTLTPATTQNVDDVDDFIRSQHLLVAADRYDMERLKLMCEEKLCQNLDVGTVATILALAEQHRCDGLKKTCLEFLGRSHENMRAAMATDGFQHLRRSCPSLVQELIALMFNQM